MENLKKVTKLQMKNASASFLALFIFKLNPEKRPPKKKKKKEPLDVGAVGERVSHLVPPGLSGRRSRRGRKR